HAGGVGAQRHVEVVPELGEVGDLLDLGLHLLARLPEEQAADDDVLVARDLGVHAHAEVEHGRHAAADPGGAAGGLVDAGQQPQQRGLAGSVVPDEADAVPLLKGQGDVLEGFDDDDVGRVPPDRAPGGTEDRLLEGARLGVEDREVHARVDAVDGDASGGGARGAHGVTSYTQ